TLRIPYENYPGAFTIYTENIKGPTVWGGNDVVEITGAPTKRAREESDADEMKEKQQMKLKRSSERDSARYAYGDRLLDAAKTFLADYGDLIGLEPNERILITTKSERGRDYVYVFSGDYKRAARKVISVEGVKADLTQYKQNKISRDQLMSKFKVTNAEVSEETQPDLE